MSKLAEAEEWVRTRPLAVQETIKRLPPGCSVRAVEGRVLLAPAPGVVGQVASYFEDGSVSVTAPMAETLTSPITGNTVEEGEYVGGQCDPEWLEVVEYLEVEGVKLDEAWAEGLIR